MGGIYLSEEGKKAIEDKIVELEKELLNDSNPFTSTHTNSRVTVYKEILSSATILPIHEDWEKCVHYTLVPFFEKDLPNGVIIQKNKQS
jgi:hypothetical protein